MFRPFVAAFAPWILAAVAHPSRFPNMTSLLAVLGITTSLQVFTKQYWTKTLWWPAKGDPFFALVALLTFSLRFSRIRLHYTRCTLQRCLVQVPIGDIACQKCVLWPICGDVIVASTACIAVPFFDLRSFFVTMATYASDAHAWSIVVFHT